MGSGVRNGVGSGNPLMETSLALHAWDDSGVPKWSDLGSRGGDLRYSRTSRPVLEVVPSGFGGLGATWGIRAIGWIWTLSE